MDNFFNVLAESMPQLVNLGVFFLIFQVIVGIISASLFLVVFINIIGKFRKR